MGSMLVVTGGTGKKSGGSFIENIASNLDKVNNKFPAGICALVRSTSNTDELRKKIPSVKMCVGELRDIKFLQKSFKNVDTIVHIAGIAYSKAIVDAAIYCGVRRLILVHTTGIYSCYKKAGGYYRSVDEYVTRKCRENNIVLTILRPTMIYGNVYDNNMAIFIKMMDVLPIMPVVNGAKYELQPVHYKDLGCAYYKVLMDESNTANKNFDLSGHSPIKLMNIFHEIECCLGKKQRFISIPFWLAYLCAYMFYVVSLGKFDYREKVQRLCEPRSYSHEEAVRAFGYSTRSFSSGISDEVKEYLCMKSI